MESSPRNNLPDKNELSRFGKYDSKEGNELSGKVVLDDVNDQNNIIRKTLVGREN